MLEIRAIQPADNKELAATLRSILVEMGVPKVGTAYADKALDCMFETYDVSLSRYFVVLQGDRIVGGSGIAPLANYVGPVCELQKMYLNASLRGKGVGRQLMQKCLNFAREVGFEQVYLETMPYMEAAQQLYVKSGFYYIDGPMGDTGHCACPIHMLKDLNNDT
ncbi:MULTISPECIES: GNAT family N-acetyltransferase [unclassified Leeuwenhoekiella]|uniref:GNAT family N-acetyltransferase n=1 Tax=unclassified Leeuwenhoekiella TaxID=2615029 RepID=UPI000C4D3DEC|nr:MULTISPECIES: GNAT family N-acetyltransferase [unclassified Leeuwenhoekiella]MAW94626.1 GNAT family N-acetyltransferase [Leeuwenhoekiella sp.]MBA82049.1 GNAT family N-acetyltransferase [Leeuwenhoekiella sp.]|tara:strand:- start:11456 stop:11947 length:492 start_codon:yes stop_codon:yes gene_type:complete